MAMSNVSDHIHIPKAGHGMREEQSGERLSMESWVETTNLVFCISSNALPFSKSAKDVFSVQRTSGFGQVISIMFKSVFK